MMPMINVACCLWSCLLLQKLHEKVGKCLRSVSVKNCTSICFPPLGTGVGYSPISVARWMIEAIDSYCDCFPRSSLSHVSIVIYEKDKNTHEVVLSYNLFDLLKTNGLIVLVT